MPTAPQLASTCSDCGSPLDPASDIGCMACWLTLGLEEAESADAPATLDQFGPYTIERHEDGSLHELGRGAMGVTYRAIDLSLRRAVALKVIQSELAGHSAGARERFIREARMAAALRHANVATVYHFGIREESGQCYCAMELVEGETLEERVRRTGPVDVRTTVEIARQVAAALAAAEKQGLVHRDLKPANLMIAASESPNEIAVKVIDFGVAKALAETPDARALTQHGFIGTPAFASPEQLANSPLDARSDIYSLGASLWYLLTGHLLFHQRGSAALPLQHLTTAHVRGPLRKLLISMLALEPAARPSVAELSHRLEKIRAHLADGGNRAGRWAFAAALLALSGSILLLHPFGERPPDETAPLTSRSVAVLPFENRSDATENAFLADGLQDDVLTSLVKVSALKVIGRSSVLSYRDPRQRDLREIGRQLGVTHVLEGSVRRATERLSLTVHLTDTRDGREVWAERYDRPLAEATGLQGEVATEVARALGKELAPEEKARLLEKPTVKPEPYVLYLQGLAHERASAGKEDIILAEQLYAQAISLDPTFALAHARGSIVNSLMIHFSRDFGTDPMRKAKARALAAEALRLSPALGEAHLALGVYFYRVERTYAAALKEFATASAAMPNDPEVMQLAAWIYRRQNRWREALASFRKAQELQPREAILDFPVTYLKVRDWDGAAEAFHHLQEIDREDSAFALLGLASLEVLRNGDPAAGKAIMQKMPPAVGLPAAMIAMENWDLSMLSRDFVAAEKILGDYKGDEFPVKQPKTFYLGCTALARGDAGAAQGFFEQARSKYEEQMRDRPEDAFCHARLGLVYAYLGRKDDALRESRRAVALAPEDKDALDGPTMANNLALICARTGEEGEAIALIEHLLATPGGEEPMTLAELRLGWEWDPLRANPRFQKILAGPEPKTIY